MKLWQRQPVGVCLQQASGLLVLQLSRNVGTLHSAHGPGMGSSGGLRVAAAAAGCCYVLCRRQTLRGTGVGSKGGQAAGSASCGRLRWCGSHGGVKPAEGGFC